MPSLFDELFDGFNSKPTKTHEQKSIERAYGKAVREGEKGDGLLEVAGDDLFGWPVSDELTSEKYKARIAGLRKGHQHRGQSTPTPSTNSGARISEGSAGWDHYSTKSPATSRTSEGRSWFAWVYFGLCASLLLAYFTLLILSGYHVVDAYKLLGITPQDDFLVLVPRLWTWTSNPVVEGIIIVVFVIVGICLLPGLIACAFWLVAFAIAVGMAGAFLNITAITMQQSVPAGMALGLVSIVLLFFLFRWLIRQFAKSIFA